MKRLILTTLFLILAFNKPVKAETYTAKATAYCLKGTTATGTTVTEGRTVASKREWFGKTMIIYENDGDGLIKPQNYIGTYIVEDTGCDNIKKGYVVDIYIEDYYRAKQFGAKDIIFQIVDSEG